MAKDKQANMSDGETSSEAVRGTVSPIQILNEPKKQNSEFSAWLENVTNEFIKLKDDEKNDTLDQLIAVSGPSQFSCLLRKMDILLYCDFLKSLPMELTECLLKYLDGKSLIMCSQVSQFWNRTVNSLPQVWKQACVNAGYIIDPTVENCNADYWRSFYVEMNARRYHMKTYKSFFSKTYDRELRRVTAIFYYKGKVAAASESKTIRIWDCSSDKIISVLRTDFGISAIKFNEEFLVASSYLGFMVLLDVQTGDRLHEFTRHVGAIFCFDFSVPLNLLVSGGSDCKIKLWSIANGNTYKTLDNHQSWVIKISLTNSPAADGSRHRNQNLLLTVDKTCIWVHLVSSMSVENSQDGLFLRTLYHVPINSGSPNMFIPGIFSDGKYIYYMRYIEKSVSVFCQWDVKNKKMIQEINLKHQVKALLAVGSKYIALLKPYQCKNTPNFTVVDRDTLEKVAYWHLPHSKRMTPEAAENYYFGESSWLDGLDGRNDDGVVLAAGTDENCIYLLNWIPRRRFD